MLYLSFLKKMVNKNSLVVIGIAAAFLAGHRSGSQFSEKKTVVKKVIDERVKTVVIEKPDGTKVTTTERNTHSSSSQKETIKAEKMSAVGVRANYRLFKKIDPEIFLQSGMKCFMLSCYVEASYGIESQDARAIFGVKYSF